MTCSEVERILPELLDGAAERVFPAEFETHVKSCPACSGLVSDLRLIASESRQLAASEEPSPRVWVRIAAELRAEGLICDPATREPKAAPTRPILISTSPRRRWSAWWLAPVAAALLAAGAYVVSHEPAPQVAKQTAAAPVTVRSSVPETAAVSSDRVTTPAPQRLARKSAKPADRLGPAARPAVEPEPSAEDQQFLSVVSTLAPSMRASYESELQAVNADILETQAYVNRNPGDADARQHLMDAYQQKALLYQIALDRIQ
jgi:hypothetical protein